MKALLRFAALICSLLSLAILNQCTSDRPIDSSVKPMVPLVSAEQLAADTSFVRIALTSNTFQTVVYNALRDAHSQLLRRQTDIRVQHLLGANQQDSLLLAIKLLGFKEPMQFLSGLGKIGVANKQLKVKGIDLAKLPSDIIAKAYSIVSVKTAYRYPPILPSTSSAKKLAIGSPTTQDYTTGICELCFLNNCDECGDFGGQNKVDNGDNHGGGGGGGASCVQLAQGVRQAKINSENADFVGALLACGGTAVGAGVAVCEGTLITVIGGPFSPATGVGTYCVVYVGCAGYAIWQHQTRLSVIEAEYAQTVAQCK